MKEEVFRMDRVTVEEQGVTELNHLCMDVYAGELLGLIPVNDTGVETLFRLMKQNLPLHYGYVYYRDRLVNQWQKSDLSYNRIAVIQNQSGLADDLTVADNVFVMRHGFKKHIISRRVLNRQLEPFLREISVHLSADTCARDLSPYHRFITEIVKAVVADCRLIVLIEPCTIIGEERLVNLHRILRYYSEKGFSFVYVSQHYEEVRQICGRAALMLNGQVAKVVSTKDAMPRLLECFGVEKYTELVTSQEQARRSCEDGTPALTLEALRCGYVEDLSLKVRQGECVVVQDLNNHIFHDLVAVLSGQKTQESGRVLIAGRPMSRSRKRELAVIQEVATQSMIFPELSYLDNLCLSMDHLLPDIWRRTRLKRNIRRECAPLLGDDVFDLPVEALSRKQKLDLVYTRILLQKPKAVICVQPFMHADVEHRMRIWTLLKRLLNRGVSVVILAVNLADSLAFADRLVRIKDGKVEVEYERAEFGTLPQTTPWHELWSAAEATGERAVHDEP